MKLIVMLLAVIFASSCAHVNSVSQTSIPRNKSKIVTAQVERNIFFLLNFNNDYLDTITKILVKKCPNGSIQGILTKDENITYFPLVYHKSKVTAKGYCVMNSKRKKAPKRRS